MKILVDDREVSSEVFEALDFYANREGFEWEKKRLLVGDFLCNDVVIERKEAGDFIGSIIDGRLKEQAAKMTLNYKHRYILIRGDPFAVKSDMNIHAILGKMTSLLAKDNIKLIQVANDYQGVYAIYSLFKKHGAEEITIDDHRVIQILKNYDMLTAMLCQIPALGLDRANKISEKYDRSPKKFFDEVSIDGLILIDGIGDVIASTIMRAIMV